LVEQPNPDNGKPNDEKDVMSLHGVLLKIRQAS